MFCLERVFFVWCVLCFFLEKGFFGLCVLCFVLFLEKGVKVFVRFLLERVLCFVLCILCFELLRVP